MNQEQRKNRGGKSLISPLISAADLQAKLGNSKLKIFDVRGVWGNIPSPLYDDYLAGHIPGAYFLDWRKEFVEQGIAPNLAQVSSSVEAQQSFVNLGINGDEELVLYDDNYHMFAGRIWWAMRYWGVENVRVLNGGFKYWQAQHLPIAQAVPKITKGSFTPFCNPSLRISLEDFLIAKNKACVLDGRGVESYNGKPEDPRTGHIPGAINAPYNVLVAKDTGLFRAKEELQKMFDDRVPNWRSERIISSCGAGYSGTVAMLALAHLGVQTSLFDGSFSVWKLDPKRLVEQA